MILSRKEFADLVLWFSQKPENSSLVRHDAALRVLVGELVKRVETQSQTPSQACAYGMIDSRYQTHPCRSCQEGLELIARAKEALK